MLEVRFPHMYVDVCIMYVYICTRTHMNHLFTYVGSPLSAYVCGCVHHVCVCMHTYTYESLIRRDVRVCQYIVLFFFLTPLCACACTYVHACAHTHELHDWRTSLCTCVCMYMHVHIHMNYLICGDFRVRECLIQVSLQCLTPFQYKIRR